MRRRFLALALVTVASPETAQGGQRFLTDDPVPTPTGHWQVFAPQFSIAGSGRDFCDALETEPDYGMAPGVQLTVDFGSGYTHGASGWRCEMGDLRASFKYRLYDDRSAFR